MADRYVDAVYDRLRDEMLDITKLPYESNLEGVVSLPAVKNNKLVAVNIDALKGGGKRRVEVVSVPNENGNTQVDLVMQPDVIYMIEDGWSEVTLNFADENVDKKELGAEYRVCVSTVGNEKAPRLMLPRNVLYPDTLSKIIGGKPLYIEASFVWSSVIGMYVCAMGVYDATNTPNYQKYMRTGYVGK